MHVRAVVVVGLELLAVVLGGCDPGVASSPAETDTHETDEPLEDEPVDVLGTAPPEIPGTAPQHCDGLTDEDECVDAGCLWQPIFGAMLDEDDICATGEEMGLCFAEAFAQACEPDARRCDDGSYAWVLPAPDDAMLVARSATSCGVPQHFFPCPTSPDRLTADVVGGPTGGDELSAAVALACTCACEDPS